jgi:CDP-glycerol glycerophosphotransferase (TagB/SpsB family)/glycosyltransferase involved in cell wall biosynthesis
VKLATIRRLPRKLASAARYEGIARMRRLPVDQNAVLYEAFAGSGMLDNPEAIFRHLLNGREFQHLTHTWVIDAPAERRRLEREWRDHPSVRFVPRRGVRYWRALATAGLLINNATFPTEFAKRAGQRYLNTWHGTPLKRMGYDMPDGPRESANTLRNFVQADWLLSQNSFMTETMYRKAYRLDGSFEGEVIEAGYPRTDLQHLDAAGLVEARGELAARGVDIGARRILLYAPTWKGDSFSDVRDDVAELVATVRRLQAALGDRYAVLLKTHQSVFRFAKNDPHLRATLVPNDIPTNRVLAVTDLLVTDYSSIQFDFLGSKRPIVYFVPDLGGYAGSRGHYLAAESWPGPLATTVDELAESVVQISRSTDAWSSQRAEWAERFADYDDGEATARVVDIVFHGARVGRRTRRLDETRRPRALFYLGGLRSNGITSAGINLVNALAESGEFDVSVVYGRPAGPERRANAARISGAVRQFVRQGGMNATRLDHLRRRRGETADDRLWRDEWTRVVGDARFDTVVDFSGYSPFWARLMLAGTAQRHLIWLHNDLARDARRTVGGRRHLHRALHDTFALYGRFDELVSVSSELARINRTALASFAEAEKFTWVPNLIDAGAVRRDATVPLAQIAPAARAQDKPALAHAAERLHEIPETRWFATVGRLSPEKNQARLIRAFAQVHAQRDEARLLLIGDGPLRSELEALATALGLGDVVVFSGSTAQPSALLAHTGCFVLSSDYEGMPMVLLEAAVLGLPIITTRFGSVADALPEVELRVVAQDDDELAEAMLDHLRGGVAPTVFDADGHNREALHRAERALAVLDDGRARLPEAS